MYTKYFNRIDAFYLQSEQKFTHDSYMENERQLKKNAFA